MTRQYSTEPTDPEEFTRRFDRFYSWFAPAYDRRGGDLIRDMDTLLREAGFDYRKQAIGGFGSIHLYVATKHRVPRPALSVES